MDELKKQFKTKLDKQGEILNKCLKEKRDMTKSEKMRFDTLESEVCEMEKQLESQPEQQRPKNLIQMEEVPLSGVDKNMIDKVNAMILFCEQDLKLTGIQAHYYREYWDGNPRQYSGLVFSHDGSSKGFVYPNKYEDVIWINSEIRGYGENVQTTVAHECFHLRQGKQIDEEDAATYGRLAAIALYSHYSSVKECCDRNNIEYN